MSKSSTSRARCLKTVRTMVVLGSGGHTAEMLELVGHLDRAKYTPRTYVVASTDKLGTQKALTAEKEQHPSSSEREASAGTSVSIRVIPRSREVGQSYLTSVWTTLVALWMAFVIVYQEQPQLVGLIRQ